MRGGLPWRGLLVVALALASPPVLRAGDAAGVEPAPGLDSAGPASMTAEGAGAPEQLAPSSAAPSAAVSPGGVARVLRVELDGVVNPGTADYLIDAVKEAERSGYDALLLVLDTPGGDVASTREIVTAFLSASVPIIVYVAPAGAHAGSAGTFITMAGHIAAMAPGTNIGAAHPVTLGGKDPEDEGGEHMGRKIENDIAAFARSIAEERGRNVEWAELSVRESVSATADEALQKNVIDLIAPSEAALLEAIDGRKVTVTDGETTLHTRGAQVSAFEMTIQQQALSILGDPNIAYILVMIGFLGLMMEFYNPGLIVPGAVGVFCLLLAFIGFGVLPVNFGAVLLLAAAVALFVAELHVTSYGLLTAGAVFCLVLGSMLLMDSSDPDFYVEPSIRVSWGLVVPMVLTISAIAIGLGWALLRSRRRRATTGSEGMVGEIGKTRTGVTSEGGKVFVHGEIWDAVSDVPIPAGTEVEVLAVDRLQLKVVPAKPA